MIAATIPYLSRDNFWLNSVQKQILFSQVSDKIEVKISPESPSEPPIKRRESSYSTIECAEIGLGRFGPKREKKDAAVSKSIVIDFFGTEFWIFWTYRVLKSRKSKMPLQKKINNEKWLFYHNLSNPN